MSKELKRIQRQLPAREQFYRRCAGLAFGMLHATARRNWLHAICNSDKRLQASILRGFVDALAKEMAKAETFLLRSRGAPAKIEETASIEADSEALGLPLPKAIMKTGAARNTQTARRKAAAIRSRKYRAKKRSVTQKT